MTNFEKITHDVNTLANFFVESIGCSNCPCSNDCYNCPYCGECQNLDDHCLTLFKHWLNKEMEED